MFDYSYHVIVVHFIKFKCSEFNAFNFSSENVFLMTSNNKLGLLSLNNFTLKSWHKITTAKTQRSEKNHPYTWDTKKNCFEKSLIENLWGQNQSSSKLQIQQNTLEKNSTCKPVQTLVVRPMDAIRTVVYGKLTLVVWSARVVYTVCTTHVACLCCHRCNPILFPHATYLFFPSHTCGLLSLAKNRKECP